MAFDGFSPGRREFLLSIITAIASACAGPSVSSSAKRTRQLLQEAADLYHNIAVDLHAHPGPFAGTQIYPGASRELSSALGDMREGRLDAAVFSFPTDRPVIRIDPKTGVYQYREPRPGELYATTQSHFDKALAQMQEIIAVSPADVDAFKQKRMPCAILALEGLDPLEMNLSRMKLFYDRGIRVMQLVHYRINEIGDIMTEPARHGGLTEFGRDVVREANRLGVILDVAHTHLETLRGTLAESRHPVIDSHTRPLARLKRRRSRSDDELRAVAQKGGVIGMSPIARKERGETFDHFLKDIDYLKSIVGVNHVGIGTDINGLGTNTALPTHKDFALILAGLLSQGYSQSDASKIMGGNLMRVFHKVTENRR